MGFEKARRTKRKSRTAIYGGSGSGKTYSALLLAKGLANGGKIALIDTEHGSALMYAEAPGIPEFDHEELKAPFTPKTYGKALGEAANAGYDVVIVDSLSHAWMGSGGMLELKNAAAEEMGGNDWAGWSKVTPIQNSFIDTLLRTPYHLIVTMRSKTKWVTERDERGKEKPRKLGLTPVQRADSEYEFDTVLRLEADNTFHVEKDRTQVFKQVEDNVIFESHGDLLRRWLSGGKAPAPKPKAGPNVVIEETKPKPKKEEKPKPKTDCASDEKIHELVSLAKARGYSYDSFWKYLIDKGYVTKPGIISPDLCNKLIAKLK